MGFLDNVFKAVKKASEIASEVEAIKERTKASQQATAVKATSVKNDAYINVEPAKPSVRYNDTFYDGEDSETEVEYSFMISEDFAWRRNNAAEIDAVFVYMPFIASDEEFEKIDYSKVPYIFISAGDEEIYQLVEEFKEMGTVDGLIEKYENRQILFKCKTDYYGQTMVLYGMDRGTIWENCGIALVYNKDIEGTPLEEKLIKILDEAAETYTENIIN